MSFNPNTCGLETLPVIAAYIAVSFVPSSHLIDIFLLSSGTLPFSEGGLFILFYFFFILFIYVLRSDGLGRLFSLESRVEKDKWLN